MKRTIAALFAAAALCCGFLLCGCEAGNDNPVWISYYKKKTINPTSIVGAKSISIYAAEKEISVKNKEFAISVTFSPADSQVVVWGDSDAFDFAGEPEKSQDSWVVKFKALKKGTFVINAQSGVALMQAVTIKITD